MHDSAMRFQANEAFSRARRRALWQGVLGLLKGKQGIQSGLLSFDAVRDKLKIRGQHYAGLQMIPLDKIVGSVGRYQDFDRAFLPAQEHIRERWRVVYEATQKEGLPPIEVYKIGDAYFVRDGHHRVSVLKEMGATHVEAYVTELETPVPLPADTVEADLDLKGEYAAFLFETGLDRLRPEQQIEFTVPGQYRKLEEHIAVHRYFVSQRESREVPYGEAVARWYDEVYCPLVEIIREAEILEQFPGRTEADLYLWLIEHRYYLSEETGYEVPLEEAAADFSAEFSRGPGRKELEAGVKKAIADSKESTGR
ncbi:MAG: DUF4032 domain-containing protein [Anaerolineae bacterium]|nr:DUF4032 domain-containing protein [Anaerolineae bacterium]